MTRSIDVERALDAYLAPDGDGVPDRVIDGVLDQIQNTNQLRRGLFAPPRFTPMNTFARAAAVLVIAAVAIGALALLAGPRDGVGTPSASLASSPSLVPSPSLSSSVTPSAPPIPTLDATFRSTSNGFQIRYPSGWTVRPGVGSWPFGSTLSPGHPIADEIVTPSGPSRMRISIASLPLPSGTTMEEFRAFASPYSSPFQPDPCPPLAPIPGPLTIDSVASEGASPQKVAAVISINGCAALAELGGSIYDIEAIAGERGYEFMLDGHLSPADAQAWLATIRLEPASAPASSTSPSPSASR
ncbi:MAG TPA: hypothetical protein VFI34_06260 [Candidatus Limnocylindrales bacterium]|nr:hypothetical protein [Candidatus Limnocylindrales bacterium]